MRPCRTIQYAQSVAGKGDRILVASGTYPVRTAQDIFMLTSGMLDVQGGFDRFDHFARQAPDTNRTTLVGVPLEFRQQLRDRGFHVVVDRKGLRPQQRQVLEEFRAGFAAMQASSGRVPCNNGRAGEFPCDRVDLLSHVALTDLQVEPSAANDIWGFVDLNTEREYALLGLNIGLAVIDVTDPEIPFQVGQVAGNDTFWRDVKVFQVYEEQSQRWRTFAYVSAEAAEQIMVIDLTGLPNRISLAGRVTDNVTSHNVYVSNVDFTTNAPVAGWPPPLLQVLGSNKLHGAFRAYGLTDPVAPSLAGQSPGDTAAHYTHDATSMLVDDARATACQSGNRLCEVLFDFSETTFDIWDFSDQANPKLLSSTTYDRASYVHSGWLSEDRNYLFVHDELDEQNHGLNTTLRVFDLKSLVDPVLSRVWEGPTAAIDHNGYVRGNRYYMSNYTRGFTVLDITEPDAPRDVGRFDTFPVSDSTAFDGAWGVYPYLPSGNILVSDFSGGLYVVADRTLDSRQGKIAFTAPAFGGEEGTDLTVSASRTGGSSDSVSVDYRVYGASAGTGDIALADGRLNWPAGDTGNRTITVPLSSDSDSEPIERAFVRLENPTGGAVLDHPNLASLFVGDAGAPASLGFLEQVTAVRAGAERAVVAVQRQGNPAGAVTASVAVSPDTAVAGTDYRAPSTRRLRWDDGDARPQSIVISLLENDETDPTRRFRVQLSSPAGATLAGGADSVVEIRRLPPVTGLVLVDAARDSDIAAIGDGQAIEVYNSSAGSVSIRADVESVPWLGSLKFDLTGPVETSSTDNDGPYALFGDDGQGDYYGEPLVDGSYGITATPYWERDGSGEAGTPLTLSFSISGIADPALGRVGGVRIEPVAAGLTVSWNAVAGADGYRVQWRTESESFGTDRERVIGEGDVTEFTITPLEAGTEYHVRIIATRRGVADAEPSAIVNAVPRSLGQGPRIGDWTLGARTGALLNVAGHFDDPEQRPLTYSVAAADPEIVDVTITQDGDMDVVGNVSGQTTVTVTATATSDDGEEFRITQTFVVTVYGRALVPLFPSASDSMRQGFVRVINRSSEGGEIRIAAIDDAGHRYPAAALTIQAGAAAHFNSRDIENGNPEKGLSHGVGPGTGDWRLELDSDLDFEALSYIRTSDGFLTAVHDRAPVATRFHRIATFNPASNRKQVSILRIVNLGGSDAEMLVVGIDDTGASPTGGIGLRIPAGQAAEFTAAELETGMPAPDRPEGGEIFGGLLGDGKGKWQLLVETHHQLAVTSLLRSPTGHLTNLSTAPSRTAPR
ncbi:MAG: choice-of-anchor B family protein [Gammaproteobacteria bacterium]|nr:choice-of-anchor B family protein [Gammaproteobacteria bacterium]MDE0368384.1 choice-of-anchor B family protein [Gammaproteobacteria bacterium]